MKPVLTVTLLLMLMNADAYAGTILYSDLGPGGDVYDTTVNLGAFGVASIVAGSGALGVSYSVADPFSVSGNGILPVSQIDLAVSQTSFPNTFHASIWTDAGGLPGAELAGAFWSLSTGANGTCCGLVSITGITGVDLVGGGDYFMVLGPQSPSGNSFTNWSNNSIGVTGPVLESLDVGADWYSEGSGRPLGAFDVISAASPLLPDLCPTDPLNGDCFFGYNTNPPAPPLGYYWTSSLPMYDFPDSTSGDWFDPSGASGYLYEMTGSSLFTDILDFPTGFDEPFDVTTPGCAIPGTFQPGQSVDFVALCGQGVSEFAITGIDPSVDPTDSSAFPIELAFNTPSADFIAEPLLASPEPTTMALFGIGLVALMALKMGKGPLSRRARASVPDLHEAARRLSKIHYRFRRTGWR